LLKITQKVCELLNHYLSAGMSSECVIKMSRRLDPIDFLALVARQHGASLELDPASTAKNNIWRIVHKNPKKQKEIDKLLLRMNTQSDKK